MKESLRIVEQAASRLEAERGPVMIDDPKIGWPVRLEVGPDGIGNSNAYIKHIMEESMEALIHHFKMVTQGVSVPAGEVYVPVEAPRGELGLFVVSDGGHKPYRVHMRDPSFSNLQALPIMVEGGLIADTVAVISSVDPVMGGVDR
jgi:NADH-quinone oxidoreductase subunit D